LYFTPREREWLERQPPAERSKSVAAIWTRKEAVLKALGLGLTYPPEAIEVPLRDTGPALAAAGHSDRVMTSGEWWVTSFTPWPDWFGALAGAGRTWTMRSIDWEPL
jgi:4'-phosphopantetheinyl transferase